MEGTDRLPAPVWLLPNLLALDAPLVAAVWQRFLAAQFRTPVPVAATAVLVLTVWAIYLADRLFDAYRGDRTADRHEFAGRFPRTFAALGLSAAAVAAVGVTLLPPGYFVSGLVVALGVAAYLAVVHLAPGMVAAREGAKELLVGIGFAAGAALPLAVGGLAAAEWLPSVAAFGGLCWLNCRLIDHWEGGGRLWVGDVCLWVAVVASAGVVPFVVGFAVAGGAAGLLAVHLTCRRRVRVARALADAVLLTPLLLGLWA